MDRININFKEVIPHVINAYSKVYGEEFREHITDQLNNAVLIQYLDIEGLENYLMNVKICKKFECAIKLLDKIGIDVEKYKDKIYEHNFDDETKKIVSNFINYFLEFDKKNKHTAPLQAFKKDNPLAPLSLLKNRLKIINYLLDDNEEKVTDYTLNEFTKTDRFNEILKQIELYNTYYDEILDEYEKFEEKLKPYEEFIEKEYNKKKEASNNCKIEAFNKISDYLTESTLEIIKDKSLDEKIKIILGNRSLDEETLIESFSDENILLLESKDTSLFEKYLILNAQKEFFNNLGIDIKDNMISEYATYEEINEYIDFLDSPKIRKYIPDGFSINHIKDIREESYNNELFDYYSSFDEFWTALSYNNDNKYNRIFIYNIFKNKQICVTACKLTNQPDESITFMHYTIGKCCFGYLALYFLHECGHVIDYKSNGFELPKSKEALSNSLKNPYNEKYRLNERFNETLTDIFANEANEILQKEGIFLLEPKEFTSLKQNTVNTSQITRNIVMPLLAKFRKQVIKAKIYSQPSELTKYIGEFNFNTLVDIVNKVDFLCSQGLEELIDTEPNHEMVLEYKKQLERTEKLYEDINNYYEYNLIINGANYQVDNYSNVKSK